jgi:thiamine pyrophosphate-dependent acetolactate synthase large subunit-like protein
VLIDVPKDIGQGPCNAPFTDKLDLPGYSVPSRGNPDAIAEAARLLSESRKPLLYVGHGAVIADAGKAITTLARSCARPWSTRCSARAPSTSATRSTSGCSACTAPPTRTRRSPTAT